MDTPETEILSGAVAPRPGGPGRPRSFDAEAALEQALALFWKKGYEGTSLSDLTTAMGISRPSLYAAYGNKEALFRKALARYLAGPAAMLSRTLETADVRTAIRDWLECAADFLACPEHPSGCLMVQGALSCGEGGDVIRAELAEHRRHILSQLRERLERGRREGQLPADCAVDPLARYFATVQQGLAVQANSGATPADLKAVVGIALAQWST